LFSWHGESSQTSLPSTKTLIPSTATPSAPATLITKSPSDEPLMNTTPSTAAAAAKPPPIQSFFLSAGGASGGWSRGARMPGTVGTGGNDDTTGWCADGISLGRRLSRAYTAVGASSHSEVAPGSGRDDSVGGGGSGND